RNLPRKESTKPRRYLNDREVIALATATRDPMLATLVLVLAYCGLRWSEAIGLRAQDINMLRRRLHINRAAVEVDGVVEVGLPKTWEKRTVPFPEFLAEPLGNLIAEKSPGDLVFSNADGSYLRRAKSDEAAESWFAKA